MKVKNFILMVFVASMTFVSCDKGSEEDLGTDNVNVRKSVSVTIANQKNVGLGSRAVAGDGLTPGNGTDVPVVNADELCALFADNTGKVLDVRKLSDVVAEDINGTKYTFHILPEGVMKVAFTNNSNSAITSIISLTDKATIAAQNVNLTAVKNAQDNLPEQNPTTGDMVGKRNAILVYGESSQFEYIGDDKHDNMTYKYYDAGSVTVTPALARLEISGFKCEDLNGTTEVDGMLPKYSQITIDRIGLNNTPFDVIGGTANDWGAGNTGEAAWIAARGWYIDENVGLTLSDASTASNQVFAFNVAPGNVPQIILHISDGEWNTNITPVPNKAQLHFPYYVKTKMDDGLSGNGLDATGFKAGYIYQVNFVFTCDVIRPWTPAAEICVDVTVVIPKWTVISNLKPEFD